MGRSAPSVSVVVPTLNGGDRFLEVLRALDRQSVPHELLVVDSGSTDGSWEAAAARRASVVRIPRHEFQHGRTRNLAIGRARGELVALLTQDAVPLSDDYLARLVAPFEDQDVAGAYARQVPRPDIDPILGERLRTWSASRTEREVRCLVRGDPAASRTLFDELEPMERYLRAAFDDVASCVRRSAWERIPIPARSFGEDVAWGREVLLAGLCLAYEPAAAVEHSHRIDMGREFRRLYCDHRNLNELFGLRNVRSWSAVLSGGRGQARSYRDLLARQELHPVARFYWRLYSIPYAYAETCAQFLGARSPWKARESRLWRAVDARVRRGFESHRPPASGESA